MEFRVVCRVWQGFLVVDRCLNVVCSTFGVTVQGFEGDVVLLHRCVQTMIIMLNVVGLAVMTNKVELHRPCKRTTGALLRFLSQFGQAFGTILMLGRDFMEVLDGHLGLPTDLHQASGWIRRAFVQSRRHPKACFPGRTGPPGQTSRDHFGGLLAARSGTWLTMDRGLALLPAMAAREAPDT